MMKMIFVTNKWTGIVINSHKNNLKSSVTGNISSNITSSSFIELKFLKQ